MIERLLKGIDTCSKAGAYLSALSMLVIVGLIMIEVTGRSLFGVSTLIADEYSGYLMVAIVMLGLGHALASDSHIRITALTGHFSPGLQRGLEVVTTLVALALGAFALYHAVLMVHDTWTYGMRADSISETPLFLPQLLIPVGLLLLDLQLLAYLLRRLLSYPNP